MTKTAKIKKILVYALVACLLLVCGGGVLVSCNPDESAAHTHNWSDGYSYDEEYHFKTCSGCDEHTGTEAHVYDDDADATCNVCDYVRHIHTLVWKWDADPNGQHWQEYSCEHHDAEKLNAGAHDFTGKNPNVCSVCGYDKTPPHTHHEVVKYDEDQHWTGYDCEEHKDVKIDPQPHTYNNDPDGAQCDSCAYNRNHTEHTVSDTWSHDETSHWKIYTCWHHADEQIDKADHEWVYNAATDQDECSVCKYSVAHAHTNYTYAVKMDGSQHWKSYACHPNEKIDAEGHDFGADDSEACSCGLEHIYLDVYELYSANQTYLGKTADAFGDWYEAVKAEENFDHVAINAVGDAVFYYAKAAGASGFDETVKYYAPRTYVIMASAGTPAKGVESVWFTVKATVGGELQTIADGKTALAVDRTGADGTVKLTFTPVWGYTSSGENAVAYTVNISEQGEIGNNPFVMPSNYLYEGEGKALTVDGTTKPSETDAAQNFALTQCLGLGERAMIENQVIAGGMENRNMSVKIRLANGLAEGWYLINMETIDGSDGVLVSNGMLLTIEGTDIYDMHITIRRSGNRDGGGGGLGYYMVYLTSACKELSFYSVGSAQVANITLTKHSNVVALDETAFIRANGTSEKHEIEYTIKKGSIANGKYLVTLGRADVSAIFDDGEPVSIATYSTLEFTGNETKVKFVTTGVDSVTMNLSIVPMSLPENSSAKLTFDQDQTVYAFSWTPSESGTYRMTLSCDGTFSGVTISIGNTSIIAASAPLSESDSTYYKVGYFDAVADREYQIQVNYSGSDYLAVTFKIEDEPYGAIEADKEVEVEFDGMHLGKYLTGQFEPGLYAVSVYADELDGFAIGYKMIGENSTGARVGLGTLTSTNTPKNYFSTLFYVSEGAEYIKEGKVTLLFDAKYSKAITGNDKVTKKIKITKIADNVISNQSIGSSFECSFAQNNIFAFDFTPETDTLFNLNVKAEEADLSCLKIMYCAIAGDNGAATTSSWLSAVADATNERSYTHYQNIIGGTRYIVVLCYQNTENAPSKVTVTLKKGFANPTLTAHNNNSSGTSGQGGASGFLRTGVGFAAVENATLYELYEAVTDSSTAPAIGDEAFKLVKTYTSADATKYKVNSTGTSTFNYINNDPDNNSKYFYYYLKVSGSDEFAPYITGVVQGHTYAYSNKARRTYKVQLNIPEELVGEPFYITLTQTNTNYVFGFDIVTPQSTSETFTILSTQTSSGLVVTGTAGWNYQAYTFPAKQTVSYSTADKEVVTTIDVIKKTEITATVKLPENFIGGFSGYIRVYLYKGSSKVGSNQNISLQKDQPAKESEYTFTFYTDKVTEADKDNYYIGFGLDSGNKLADGYILPDKVKVNISEDFMTGTAEVTFADRCGIELDLSLPANFTGGNVTVSAFEQIDDEGGLAQTASTTNTVTLEAGEASAKHQKLTIYVPIGHTYTVKLAFDKNLGYTANDVADINGEGTSASASFTVVDHIVIAVTVELEKDLTLSSGTTIYLYDKEDGTKSTTTAISSASVKFEEGETSRTVNIYAPLGLKGKQFVIGGAPSANQVGTYTYSWSDYSEVIMTDVTGTATFELQKSYGVHLHITHEYSSRTSDKYYVVMDGVQVYSSSVQFYGGSGVNYDRNVYIPVNIYKADAKFYTYADINSSMSSTWICPAVEFSFAPGTKDVDVTLGHIKKDEAASAASVNVTIKFPEGYEAGTTNYTFGVYQPGATTALATLSVTSATLKEALEEGNEYSFVFDKYMGSTALSYMFYDSTTITRSTDSTVKKYYCEPTNATYDEATQSYSLTINIKERPKVQIEVNVTAPEELTATGAATFSLSLYDDKGGFIQTLSNLKLEQGEHEKSFTEYIYVLDIATFSCKTATASFSDAHYSVSAEVNNAEGKYSVNVTFAKQRVTDFIVNFKFDGFTAVRGESYSFSLKIYAAGDRKTALSTQSISISGTSNSGKSEINNAKTFAWGQVWAEGEYEIVVERPNYTNEFVCVVEVVKAETGDDTYYVNVTVKKK